MENNKLIAEFMGKDYNDIYHTCTNELYESGYRDSDYINNDSNWKCYHSSWDWLMLVVEKIESLDLTEYGYQWGGIDGKTEYNNGSICVEIEQDRCWIYMNLSLDPPNTLNEKTSHIKFPTKIEATYAAVVEFIEYYNELIKNQDK